ncbi:MAG: hypothetical protein AAF568_09680 [Pseudomonadota bacterium]
MREVLINAVLGVLALAVLVGGGYGYIYLSRLGQEFLEDPDSFARDREPEETAQSPAPQPEDGPVFQRAPSSDTVETTSDGARLPPRKPNLGETSPAREVSPATPLSDAEFDQLFDGYIRQFGNLPQEIGPEVELTRASSADRTISLYFTLKIDAGNLNRQSLKEMEDPMRAQICRDAKVASLASADAKMTMIFADQENRVVYRFFLDPKSC